MEVTALAPRIGKIIQIHGLEAVQRELGDLVVEAKLPKAGQTPTGTYEGEGYVIVRHPETEVVKAAVKTIVETIRIEYA